MNMAVQAEQLTQRSEAYIKALPKENLPAETSVYPFSSRARGGERRNSDFDIWRDCTVDRKILPESRLVCSTYFQTQGQPILCYLNGAAMFGPNFLCSAQKSVPESRPHTQTDSPPKLNDYDTRQSSPLGPG
jgi:hypothetical protein